MKMFNMKRFMLMIAVAGSVSFSTARAQVNQQIMDTSADQSQGNYTPMNLDYAGFNSLGMTQAAWLDPLQNLGEGQSRPAYSKYYWTPDLVLPIRVREGMLTMVNFPEWELIEDIYLGDQNTFDGQISGPSTLLLYPRSGAQVGVDTNAIVFGRSGNRYVFYLKSEAVNTERLTNAIIDIEVVNDNVPNSGNGVSPYSGGKSGSGAGGSGSKGAISTYTKRFQKSDWIQSIPVDPSDFKFDLEVYVPNPDDVVIAPERVWRDNIFTYIDLGKKSLNMVQRPVVSMIVERVEVPVGFRAKGPDNRLIVVEGIGDMVLRNGKRIICIKMRRSDESGLEYAVDSADYLPPTWDVGSAIPNEQTTGIDNNINRNYTPQGASQGGSQGFNYNQGGMGGGAYGTGNYGMTPVGQVDIQTGQGQIIVPEYAKSGNMSGGFGGNAADNFDYSKMQHISMDQSSSGYGVAPQFAYGYGFSGDGGQNISIELGTDGDVNNLESLWGKLSTKYKELSKFTPFFSVDAPADGQGRELFHLRVGPVKNLEEGDSICSSLGRSGVFCSVVRTQ